MLKKEPPSVIAKFTCCHPAKNQTEIRAFIAFFTAYKPTLSHKEAYILSV